MASYSCVPFCLHLPFTSAKRYAILSLSCNSTKFAVIFDHVRSQILRDRAAIGHILTHKIKRIGLKQRIVIWMIPSSLLLQVNVVEYCSRLEKLYQEGTLMRRIATSSTRITQLRSIDMVWALPSYLFKIAIKERWNKS